MASYDDSSDESMDENELEMISKSLEGELLVLYGVGLRISLLLVKLVNINNDDNVINQDTSNSKKNNLPKQLPKPIKKVMNFLQPLSF